MILKVTNKESGKCWTETNESHSWQPFVLDWMKHDNTIHLVYCDMECLLKGPDGQWYALDECGNWEYIPDWYKVEEMKDGTEVDTAPNEN